MGADNPILNFPSRGAGPFGRSTASYPVTVAVAMGASEESGSRADAHDLDKLRRWHDSLAAMEGRTYPVYAAFLVSVEDTTSHDIFRRFRASFESRAAPFHCLVIFGQHGVSSTVRQLSAHVGLRPEDLPALVLWTRPTADGFHVMPLPVGASTDDGRWAETLSRIEEAADRKYAVPGLDTFPGFTPNPLPKGSLVDLVGEGLDAISRADGLQERHCS